ncbi:transglycosylase SLT domain-containing protein [Limobrevibacterium gyesilva]|uniref:Transglycosylase SLT domain-containing protein n=1 Tax=Limobrevibacterium gyesilva TaxID=2991712 RepID=A0AA41YM93_9PROT|nr:transglycosylase SLT domain-containing protein [Limobrevibacterium gyesilva]MCW3476094.1 transglycosylase SLT domain-containing protein [Limobrevibacterium gyesilva]
MVNDSAYTVSGMRILITLLPGAASCAALVGSLIVCTAAARAESPARQLRPLTVALQPSLTAADPAMQCRVAIRNAERAAGIPTQLMAAIARVESGRPDAQGVIHPWPWTINVEGDGYSYASKTEAIAAVRAFQQRGARSIDVGCMQVNLMYHPNAFASLDEAFDPVANAVYAARFLGQLYSQSRDWARATASYHSATPERGEIYQRKVAAVLPEEMKRLLRMPGGAPANVWSTNVWSSNVWNSHGTAWPAQSNVLRPPAPLTAQPAGAYRLSNKAETARILPAPQGTVGRGLDAYRAVPIPVASRQVPRTPL